MSNTIEFREVQKRSESGDVYTIESWWEYRTKDTIISVLGVSLSNWSDWQRVDVVRVDQNGTPL